MLTGAILGAVGSVINQGIGIYRDKQQAAIDTQRRADEIQLAQINAGKDGLVASYAHDSTLQDGVSPWAANVRAMVRPVLTFYALSIVTLFYFYAAPADQAIIIASAVEFSAMAGTWWFADRFRNR